MPWPHCCSPCTHQGPGKPFPEENARPGSWWTTCPWHGTRNEERSWTLCCEGDRELQHCLSAQGDGGTLQVLRCAAVRGGCTSSLMPGHPNAAFITPYNPLPASAPASVRRHAGQRQMGLRVPEDGGSLPSSLGPSPRHLPASPQPLSWHSPPGGCPCLPGQTPGPTAPSPDPCLVSSVDNTIKESTTRGACQIETSSSVLLPEQPAGRQNTPIKH